MLDDIDVDGYFRAGVGACLINGRGEVLIMRRVDVADAWQMPQGGIQHSEDPEQALVREVLEETGLGKDDFRILTTTGWIAYQLPQAAWRPKTGRGQTQKWFQCLVNEGTNIIPDREEFDAFRWVEPDEVIALAADFRKDAYQSIIDSFSLC